MFRFAIIGCGKISRRHATEAARHGKLVAVCDIRKDRADKLAADFDARSYNDIDEVFNNEDLDVVAICTPNGLHAQHSIASLRAGNHVLCEKPLSTTTEDANRMIAASKEAGKKLWVVKSTRYNPSLIQLKRLIDSNELGKIYSFQLNCFWNRPAEYYHDSWKGDLTLDGGTLFTQFSHYIDAMIWLFGEAELIAGFRKNSAHQQIIDFEDNGSVSLQMKTGVIGGLNWSVNSYQNNMEVSLTVLSEKGTIEIGGEYMNHLKYQSGVTLNVPPEGAANDYGFYKGSMSNHDKVYENMMQSLQNEEHPFINGEDGLKTVAFIEKVYRQLSL
jgi:predicted dehydrogenase